MESRSRLKNIVNIRPILFVTDVYSKIIFNDDDDIIISKKSNIDNHFSIDNFSFICKYDMIEKYDTKTKTKTNLFMSILSPNDIIKEIIFATNHSGRYIIISIIKNSDLFYNLLEIDYNSHYDKYNFDKYKDLGIISFGSDKSINSFIVVPDLYALISTNDGKLYYFNLVTKKISSVLNFKLDCIIRDVSSDGMKILLVHKNEILIADIIWKWEWH